MENTKCKTGIWIPIRWDIIIEQFLRYNWSRESHNKKEIYQKKLWLTKINEYLPLL